MRGGVRVRPIGVVVGVAETALLRRLSLVDYQVDGHLALQTADITMTKVVAEFVDLEEKTSNHHPQEESCVFVCERYPIRRASPETNKGGRRCLSFRWLVAIWQLFISRGSSIL